jgi:phospholipase C
MTTGRSVIAVAVLCACAAKPPPRRPAVAKPGLDGIEHVVVVFEENHSFDNLYGGWEGVDGLAHADPTHTVQVNQFGRPYVCLAQDDVNLAALPLSCMDFTAQVRSGFKNEPFSITRFIPPEAATCPKPTQVKPPDNGVLEGQGVPGGCTRDLVHRFYQEQYQIDGGLQNRYVTGSNALGLAVGYYETRSLPIYKYLHAPGAPAYAIADRFFQAAFGGSFLNHQFLIAARAPLYAGAAGTPGDLHAVVDANGMPASYPLYRSPLGPTLKDELPLAAACHPTKGSRPPPGVVCGDQAVNTIQPAYEPRGTQPPWILPPIHDKTIGDELSEAGIDWAWYSGGWSNADGDRSSPGWTNGKGPHCGDPDALPAAAFPHCPDVNFQFHHQPFNYFARYAPETEERKKHLRDQEELMALLRQPGDCALKAVSFVKPVGRENEHPGYASEPEGSDKLVALLQAIEGSSCKNDTLVVVTYDEFGGQWDHVPPPAKRSPTQGPYDEWGPGTRIPALILAPGLAAPFVVDHEEHDTLAILTTIEHRFKIAPLDKRDGRVSDLSSIWKAQPPP